MLTVHPSAWLPLAMSLAALTLVIVHVVRFGITREADEGTAARFFQLLMAGQIPVIVFFAVRWGPRAPREALQVVAIQAVAGFLALAVLFLLERGVY